MGAKLYNGPLIEPHIHAHTRSTDDLRALKEAGVVALVAAWGLWLGRGWAWVIVLIIFIIGIIMDLVTLPTGIVGVVIDAIVLYLLTRPDTRRFCGK